MKVVSILSGGLDSTVLTYYLVDKYGSENVFALTFYYNQKHQFEIEKASKTCQKLNIQHKIIDISFLGDIVAPVSALSSKSSIDVPELKDVLGDPQPITYVPFRNTILLSLALSFAESNGCEKVFYGAQKNDLYGYWDTTEEYVNKLNDLIQLNRKHKITVEAPFTNFTKADEIKLGLKLNVDFKDTNSCYTPNEKGEACGVCPTCKERLKGFEDNNIKDPIPYAIAI